MSRSGCLCFKSRNLQLVDGNSMLLVSDCGHCKQIQILGEVESILLEKCFLIIDCNVHCRNLPFSPLLCTAGHRKLKTEAGLETKFTFLHNLLKRNRTAMWLLQSRSFPACVLTYNGGMKRASKKSFGVNGKQVEAPVVLRCSVTCV